MSSNVNGPPYVDSADASFDQNVPYGVASLPWVKPRRKQTFQIDVEPGDKTGIYYITFCNLPFGTSWQGLREFIGDVCQVEHVQVFGSSTSGWARFKGKDNFEKAWDLLNRASYNGRCIIASDKNKSETIKIKELVRNPMQPSPERREQVSRLRPVPRTMSTARAWHEPKPRRALPPSYMTSSCVPQYPSDVYSVSDSSSYSGRSVSSYSTTLSTKSSISSISRSSHGSSVESVTATQFGRAHDSGAYPAQHVYPVYQTVTHITRVETCHQYDPASPVWSSHGAYPRSEPRKIFVTHLSQEAAAEDVAAWIRSRLGPLAAHIDDIEIPLGTLQPTIRGHAFVVFAKASSALKAVAIIDRLVFQGYIVRARLAAEGVPVTEPLQRLAPVHQIPPETVNKRTFRLHAESKEFVPLAGKPNAQRPAKEPLHDAAWPVVVNGTSVQKEKSTPAKIH